MLKPLSLIAALLALCAVASGAQTPSTDDQLAAAEAKWAMKKPQAYEFTFKLIACCVIPLPPNPAAEPIVFLVENGTPSLVSGAHAAGLKTAYEYNTVEKQFAFIRTELAKRHYRMETEYDPELGYPRRVYIKWFQNAADDEYTVTIEGFRSLARQ